MAKPIGKFDRPDRDCWQAVQALLPPEIARRLRHERAETGKTVQQLVCEALDQALPQAPETAHLRKCALGDE